MQILGAYKIIGKISEGAFCQIFIAQKGRELFAIKKLKSHLKYDFEYTKLLRNEARLLSGISDYKYFPRFYELGEEDDEVFLVLELIEGVSVERLIQKVPKGTGRLPTPMVCLIAREIALGLQNLHSLHVGPGRACVHADLRPSNVMISTQGEVKLIDLGLKGGSFTYMPLQRLHTRTIDYSTDLYALGHILYELLHGECLFKGERRFDIYVEMREKKINIETFDPQIPLPLREILVRLLNQEGEVYYRSTTDLVEDLNKMVDKLGVDLEPPALGEWIKQFIKSGTPQMPGESLGN